MIFRDDDVSKYTDLTTFIKIHDLFKKYNKTHLCVVEMEDLWESKGIWYLLCTELNIEIGLHCWKHKDYTQMSYSEIKGDVNRSLEYWKQHTLEGFGKIIPITTLYPTWNRSNATLQQVCNELGLKLNYNTNPAEVYCFHWWNFINGRGLEELEALLR